MEIKPVEFVRQRKVIKSIIPIRTTIQLDHPDDCNCYFCANDKKPIAFRYVQPEVPKPFKPVNLYQPNINMPFETMTTYNNTFVDDGRVDVPRAYRRDDTLAVGDGQMTDLTVNKMSFAGHWGQDGEMAKKAGPWYEASQWYDKTPIDDNSIYKYSYTWKYEPPSKPIKALDNIYCSDATLNDYTVYKLSFFPNRKNVQRQPIKPENNIKQLGSSRPGEYLCRSAFPNQYYYGPGFQGQNPYGQMTDAEKESIMRLSYQPVHAEPQEKPWAKRAEYQQPPTPMQHNTSYKLSFSLPGVLEPIYDENEL